MTTAIISKFDTAVCAGLSAMRGGDYAPTGDGLFYSGQFGDTVQVMDTDEFKSYVRECYASNDNGAPSDADMQREMDESPKMLVDYDLDEHGNRYSEFVYVITLN